MKSVPIVIPAYEPDERFIKLCKELYNNKLNDVIIINDGSNKNYDYIYDTIATKYKFVVLNHHVNLGKGRGLKTAFNYLLTTRTDLLGCITADSDGQHSVKDIKKMIKALRKNPSNLIIGCRNFKDDSVPFKSKYGNQITKVIMRLFCSLRLSDTQTGLRGIPREFMSDLLTTNGDRFEFETNMLIESKGKYPITEVEIETIYDSKENHSTHFNPILDSYKIYKSIFRVFFKYIFSSLSSSIIDIGLFYLFCKVLKQANIGLYIILATVFARIISSLYNCILNYKVVFKSTDNKRAAYTKYFILVIIQMCLSAMLVYIFAKIFSGISETLIKLIVDTLLFFVSFTVQRTLIFKK